jgi:hypothetical protein
VTLAAQARASSDTARAIAYSSQLVFWLNGENDQFVMDAEVLGGGARKVIEQEANRRGMTPLLRPLTPFHSSDWPWKTDPTKGQGPTTLEEAVAPHEPGHTQSPCQA